MSFARSYYYDDYDGKVCAEGWDGTSFKTVTSNGTVFKGTPVVDMTIYAAASGWKFKPLDNIAVTSLGFWRLNGTYSDLSLRLYDPTVGMLLARCTPNGTGGDFWDWCPLTSPVSLFAYNQYIVSCHKSESSSAPYWTGVYRDRISFEGIDFEGAYRMEGSKWVFDSDYYLPKCDFNFTTTKIVYISRFDCLHCDVYNVPPKLSVYSSAIDATATLRIAGEKWHDVSAFIVDGDSETLVASLIRQPGAPQEISFPVTIDLTKSRSIRVEYTPEDDTVNGQPYGATPTWLTFTFDSGPPMVMKHTFNVRQEGTWQWTVGLNSLPAGTNLVFTATATDPGMDDLTFTWDWGDGTPAIVAVYPNSGYSPFTATDIQSHAYASAGTYTLMVKASDDDGGEDEVQLFLTIVENASVGSCPGEPPSSGRIASGNLTP